MEYELSQHAKDALQEREISVAWLEHVLRNPQKTEKDPIDPDLEHHLGRIKEHENRVLRVILKSSVKPVRIVTVYFDRAMRNKL